MGEARVRASGAVLSDRVVERAIVRGPGGVTGPPTGVTVLAFTLPDGATGDGLRVSSGAGVTSISVWQGGEWRRLDAGRGPTLAFPAAAFVDGRAYVRVAADLGPGGPAAVFLTGTAP